jgi:hypothetical protein
MIDGAAAVLPEHAARVRIVDHHDAAEFLGQAHNSGSGPRSPSMLKTPSVMSSLRWEGGSDRSTWRAASTSFVREHLDRRPAQTHPSMMLA